MDRSIKAGVTGFLLVVIVNLFSPVYLYFIPSFLIAIFVIYIFTLGTLKDGLVAAFMTYIFSEGILATIDSATYYLANEPYPSTNIDIWTMLSPIVWAVTAVIASYMGVRLAQKKKPARELPPPVPPEPVLV